MVIGAIKVTGVNSGGAFNTGLLLGTNTHSKMNMQGQAGSFNIGDANVINNAGSGLFTAPIMSDSDAADVVV